MRVPVSWLRDYVRINSNIDIEQLHQAFVSLGFEVENVETYGSVKGELVCGEIIAIKNLDQFKKPIRYCTVKIGTQTRGIVCGATNFTVGDKVVVALPGTVLPGDFEISARKTYDHLSEGMICSERELGISDSHTGILVLNRSVKSGSDVKKILGLGESVFELSVLPDRGYALSMRGIAREIAGYFNLKFEDPIKQYSKIKPGTKIAKGKISAPKKVSNFTLATLSGVNPKATTPEFIKLRLQQMGMRSISLPVDVTNYVMLELGQPLHAFDRKLVKGTIAVRFARNGEKIKTLDNQNRSLIESDLVISDSVKAISIAGIMGGANSEISEKTKEIVIEAATFDAATISATARRLGLTSEASKRFERGCDPNLPEYAAKRAAQLLVEYGGGKILGAHSQKNVAPTHKIKITKEQVQAVTGLPLSNKQISTNLEKIGARLRASGNAFTVSIPSWRNDLLNPNDLIEEILRLHGYQFIKGRLPKAPSGFGLTKTQKTRRQVGQVIAGMGAHEVLTYPFMSQSDIAKCLISEKDERSRVVTIHNPLSEEKPLLRSFLIPGLLEVSARNIARGYESHALFELGNVFFHHKDFKNISKIGVGFPPKKLTQKEIDLALPIEKTNLALIAIGQASDSGWWGEGYKHSSGSVGQMVYKLFNQLGISIQFDDPLIEMWHPGRSQSIKSGDQIIGHFGQLHPQVAANFGLNQEVFGFEINLDAVYPFTREDRRFKNFGKMPYAIEDLALVVAIDQEAGVVQDAIMRSGGQMLESVNLFDVFTGNQVGEGKKSLTFRLLMRADDRTLTSEDLAKIRERILRRVNEDFGARVRS